MRETEQDPLYMISFTVFMIIVKLFSVHRNRKYDGFLKKPAEANSRITKMLE